MVLDEPTTGVDPVSRREFWRLLSEFLSQGITIFMATPYLDEAERCSRVALLNEGRLLALDRPAAPAATLPGRARTKSSSREHRQAPERAERMPGVPTSRCSASGRTCASTRPTTERAGCRIGA